MRIPECPRKPAKFRSVARCMSPTLRLLSRKKKKKKNILRYSGPRGWGATMPERSGTSGVFGAFQGITLPTPTPVLISHGWHAPRVPVAFCRSAGVGGPKLGGRTASQPPSQICECFLEICSGLVCFIFANKAYAPGMPHAQFLLGGP